MSNDLIISQDTMKVSTSLLLQSNELTIVDNQTNKKATDLLKENKQCIKLIESECDPEIASAHELHKNLVAKKNKYLLPHKNAEQILKIGISKFLRQEEDKRREAERKLQEEARKKEDKRRAELEEQAKKAEAKGNLEKAEARREQAEQVHIPVPIIPEQVEKQQGIQKQVTWKFRITFPNLVPAEFLIPDEKKIGGVVRAMKGETKINGVVVYSEESVKVKL